MRYIIALCKPWNLTAFERRRGELRGQWDVIEGPQDLTLERLQNYSPRYVFLPHWSWRVPEEITENFACVCFHMTDVPYGRGGSPLQNLILRGHQSTVLSALKMAPELDAGPVYLKKPLSLAGTAQQIFERAAAMIMDMIVEITETEPIAQEQVGDVVSFRRRRPEESLLPRDGTPASLYDFIRMLDAPTYPVAFIEWGEWRIEFNHASLESGDVRAQATIRRKVTS